MPNKVKNGDAGVKLLKAIRQAKGQEVAVGLPQEKGFGNYGDNTTVLEVGAVHEFGNPRRGIPQRSFLKTPFIVKDRDLKKLIESQWSKIVSEKQTVKKGLDVIGVWAVGTSQKAFTTKGYGTWRDITQETKDRKGSSQILIDTGLLRQSITYQVRGNK